MNDAEVRWQSPDSWSEVAATIARFAERDPIDLSRLDVIEAALDLPLRDNPLLTAWHAVYGEGVAYVEQFRWPRPGEAEQSFEERFAWDLAASALRRYTVPRYAWAIPGPEALDAIAAEAKGRGVIEVGAGLGYWAALLQRHGVDVVATDLEPDENPWCNGHEPWCEVAPMDAVHAAALAGDARRVLFMCWPSMAEWPGEAVAAYHRAGGEVVCYVGEDEGGCTGDDGLWERLGMAYEPEEGTTTTSSGASPVRLFDVAAEVAIPQWTGIHDRLVICRRGADS